MTVAEVDTEPDSYFEVPLDGLGGEAEAVPFPLYLRTGFGKWVLYRPENEHLGFDHTDRLRQEGVQTLFIRELDAGAYARRIENNLDLILKDRTIPIEQRSAILHSVAVEVAQDIFHSPDKQSVRRARNVMATTSTLVARDRQAFRAIRTVLEGSEHLALHSMTVSFLSIGLAHEVLGPDSELLLHAGLAGFLHDIGHQPDEDGEMDHNDPQHPQRGHDLLRSLGLSSDICEAVLCHHERFDGSGYPFGLTADKIPPLARIVGLVNTFHRIYTERVGEDADDPSVTFESMRTMAQMYRGCFDAKMAGKLVQLFAY